MAGREKDIGAAKISDRGVNVGMRGRDVNGANVGGVQRQE